MSNFWTARIRFGYFISEAEQNFGYLRTLTRHTLDFAICRVFGDVIFLWLYVAMRRVLNVDKHKLSEKILDVRPYHPSFGVLLPGFDSSTPRQPLPDELEVECAPEVVAFLFKSKQIKRKVLTRT